MFKLTREQKIEIYEKRKLHETLPSIAKEYNMSLECIKYLVRLIDFHGFGVLRDGKNKTYTVEQKTEWVERVLLNSESTKSVAIEAGHSSDGMLRKWINEYKSNKCVIVENKKGKPTMKKDDINIKPYENMSEEEKNKYNEQRILYLEAENEYLKKLRAVVQTRENRQSKRK